MCRNGINCCVSKQKEHGKETVFSISLKIDVIKLESKGSFPPQQRNMDMATNHQIITDIKHHGIITASAIHNIGIDALLVLIKTVVRK